MPNDISLDCHQSSVLCKKKKNLNLSEMEELSHRDKLEDHSFTKNCYLEILSVAR